jgi:hypothetical protein
VPVPGRGVKQRACWCCSEAAVSADWLIDVLW